jgi:alkylation response protein AidB-like acyl-CoA dehydrogenase
MKFVIERTEAQKDYMLPKLAKGELIPCFGLTAPVNYF